MPLDIMPTARTVNATLHYLQRGTEKPARYVSEPPPGVPRWNGIDDPHDVRIEDARGRETEFTLDRNGFALIKAPTAVGDFYSEDQIKQVYYPEVDAPVARDAWCQPRLRLRPQCTERRAVRYGRALANGCTTTTRSIRRPAACATILVPTHPNC